MSISGYERKKESCKRKSCLLLSKMYWSKMQLSATLLPVSGFITEGGVGHDNRGVGGGLTAGSPQAPILPKGGYIMVINVTLPRAGHLCLFPRSLMGKSIKDLKKLFLVCATSM